eukprot:m.743353 g.743353  ORF g.743353 m.743353 type:complete len:390 (-) comp23121_c1_seq55:1409-2578(-)
MQHLLTQHMYVASFKLFNRAKGNVLHCCHQHLSSIHSLLYVVTGATDARTAASFSKLGTAYSKMGDLDSAAEAFDKVLEIQLELAEGEFHQDIAEAFYNAGAIYTDKGEYDIAIAKHTEALEIFQRVLGVHKHTAACYTSLGRAHVDKGEYDRAIYFYSKSLSMQEDLYGTNSKVDTHSPLFCDRLCSPTKAAITRADSKAVICVLLDSVSSHENSTWFCSRHAVYHVPQLLAHVFRDLAEVYVDKEEHDNAIHYLKKILVLLTNDVGENHVKTADLYLDLAKVFQNKGDFEGAMQHFANCVRIRKAVLGADDVTTELAIRALEQCHAASAAAEAEASCVDIFSACYWRAKFQMYCRVIPLHGTCHSSQLPLASSSAQFDHGLESMWGC